MATVKVILFKSKKLAKGEHPVMLRVNKDRIRKYFALGYSCKPEQWINDDEIGGKFSSDYKNSKQKNKAITKLFWRAEEVIADFEADEIDWTLDDFRDKFIGIKPSSFYDFFEKRIVA